MTGISAVPPASSMLPTSENKLRTTTHGADFQSQLQAQSTSPVQPSDTTRARELSDSTINLSRRPEMQVMLQLLAWRKNAESAPSRAGRSVPGTRASGLDIADFNFPDLEVLNSSEVIKHAHGNEEGRWSCLKSVDERTVCTLNGEESEFSSGVICEGGLNAFVTAMALSPIVLTWLPIEIVRAPLRSPGIRIIRRRKPSSAESHLLDRSISE
ncbi:hypothetical protein SAMN05216202_2193 [Pseudomonas mucidolens]|uniref:Uncharacterized protein n=1 Tax=Pseudomonas mucidolens TaxID=46679 RepID=A0A1H2MQH7_9PSED|nr:hypothetical protein SAMN05216202_2193 [Pseudomonas mucidolens]SQH33413.1 Uncharacterised protein [Pseudomonas mucidolens]